MRLRFFSSRACSKSASNVSLTEMVCIRWMLLPNAWLHSARMTSPCDRSAASFFSAGKSTSALGFGFTP